MTTTALEQLLPRTCHVIQNGIDAGLHRGMQVYISRRFETVADFAWGENNPGEPLTTSHLLPWLSAGKPITAVAVMQRVESGQLGLDWPVADVIPEFAAAGKKEITVHDLLQHTAALKPIATGWPTLSWDQIIEKICKSGLRRNWQEVGRAGYDPARSWFILGEILMRIDTRPIERIIREDVLLPSGMNNSWLAIDDEEFHRLEPQLGVTYSSKEALLTPLPNSIREQSTHASPGGGMRGPVRELGRFYEMLLRGGVGPDGTRLLQPETVQSMTSRHREGQFDATFQHTVDFGLGLIMNSNRYGDDTVPYGYGRYASEATYGHGGAQSSVGYADPEHGLVVAAVANGRPADEIHNQRFRDLSTAIYEDLGLTGS